jgi:GNAT superfamily N-acetyltransferase
MPGAGAEIAYTVTFLEMTERPAGPYPPLPTGPAISLIHAEKPPLRYFFHLYDSVGEAYEWVDRHGDDPAELTAWLHDENVALYTMLFDGWPGGFFVLDWRAGDACDLAYFGLVPEATGRGLGLWLLGEAIRAGWEREGVEKLTLNTNSLDHPRALPNYQRLGFVPVRREERTRILTRPRA